MSLWRYTEELEAIFKKHDIAPPGRGARDWGGLLMNLILVLDHKVDKSLVEKHDEQRQMIWDLKRKLAEAEQRANDAPWGGDHWTS